MLHKMHGMLTGLARYSRQNKSLSDKDENPLVANRIVFNAIKIFIETLLRIFLSLRHDTMNLW